MSNSKPCILFVAMIDSIHSARWINQIADLNWELHIFPSMDADINREMSNISIHDEIIREKDVGPGIQQLNPFNIPFLNNGKFYNKAAKKIRKYFEVEKIVKSRDSRLKSLIQKLKPDLIHSLEFQHSAYLTLQAKELIKNRFPPWMVTNWGSDISLFGRLPEHAAKIRSILANCDFYSCECRARCRPCQEFWF